MDILDLAQPVRGGVYVAALFICVLFASLLGRSRLPHKTYIVLFLTVKALIVMSEWLLIHSSSPHNYFWLALLIVLSFGTAPLLLRFAQGISSNSHNSSVMSMKNWEWGFPLVSLMLMIPLFCASQMLFEFEVSSFFGRLIHITMSVCILLFVAQVSIYLKRAYQIYLQELGSIKNLFSDLQQTSLVTLKLLLVMVFANLIFSLIRTLNVWFLQSQAEIVYTANVLEYLILLGCLFLMFHYSLPLYASKRQQIDTQNKPGSQHGQQNLSSHGAPKYSNSSLSFEFRERIRNKLESRPLTTHLILDCTVSLSKFAGALGEKPNYISQVLSQDLNTNFYEYITERRIEEVMVKLTVPSEQTILEIALAAGFNSKSTFNTAFKKRTGLTPSVFRRQKSEAPPTLLN